MNAPPGVLRRAPAVAVDAVGSVPDSVGETALPVVAARPVAPSGGAAATGSVPSTTAMSARPVIAAVQRTHGGTTAPHAPGLVRQAAAGGSDGGALPASGGSGVPVVAAAGSPAGSGGSPARVQRMAAASPGVGTTPAAGGSSGPGAPVLPTVVPAARSGPAATPRLPGLVQRAPAASSVAAAPSLVYAGTLAGGPAADGGGRAVPGGTVTASPSLAPAMIQRSPAAASAGTDTIARAELPTRTASAAGEVDRERGGPGVEVGEVAERVYEILVRRLASERKQRGW
ncbi:MAG: hypothetical protein JO040_03700 [Gemmatimonadetes bacterium]|nr:hypothetical protein [Gemmatimonadota bacterium]